MDCVEGKVNLSKDNSRLDPITGLYDGVAYCSQLPWLQGDTIKANIVRFPFFSISRRSFLVHSFLRPFTVAESMDRSVSALYSTRSVTRKSWTSAPSVSISPCSPPETSRRLERRVSRSRAVRKLVSLSLELCILVPRSV